MRQFGTRQPPIQIMRATDKQNYNPCNVYRLVTILYSFIRCSGFGSLPSDCRAFPVRKQMWWSCTYEEIEGVESWLSVGQTLYQRGTTHRLLGNLGWDGSRCGRFIGRVVTDASKARHSINSKLEYPCHCFGALIGVWSLAKVGTRFNSNTSASSSLIEWPG
jgi:hypothetical protein